MGVLLVIHAAFRSWCETRPRLAGLLQSGPGTALRVALTFTCFFLAFVIFRCPQLATSLTMLRRMATPNAGAGLPLEAHGLYLTFAVVALGHLLGSGQLGQRLWDRLPAPVRGLGFGAALSLTLILAPATSKAFIYFQF
jgi:hypothetical protein